MLFAAAVVVANRFCKYCVSAGSTCQSPMGFTPKRLKSGGEFVAGAGLGSAARGVRAEQREIVAKTRNGLLILAQSFELTPKVRRAQEYLRHAFHLENACTISLIFF